MTWARFEDRFPWHRKVRGLSDSAFRLHVSAVCWSCEHLTDGHLPADDLDLLSDVKRPATAVDELLRKALWLTVDGGWQINDFLVYNESRETILSRREADAERKRRGREGRSPAGVRPDSTEDSRQDSPSESVRPVPARPEPTQQPPTEVVAAAPRTAKRATRVPDEWPPDPHTADVLRSWAQEHAPAVAIRSETDNWMDWHRAKGDTARDWVASWRTWMRRAQKDAEKGRGQLALNTRPQSTTDQRVATGLALVEHFREQEGA